METDISDTGRLEQLPKWLNLIPMVTQWLWLSVRYRSITLPSSCNPAIVTGGMVGEGKMDYFDAMGDRALAFVTPTVCLTCDGEAGLGAVDAAMASAAIHYPVVVKPNLGWCGYGVRKIDSSAQMLGYLKVYPTGEQFVIQDWLADAGEAGIFYMRHPGEAYGEVIGMLLREYP
ncbi:MAG: hypothetical protein ABIZ09_16360, partial [Rhodoferax sp.]